MVFMDRAVISPMRQEEKRPPLTCISGSTEFVLDEPHQYVIIKLYPILCSRLFGTSESWEDLRDHYNVQKIVEAVHNSKSRL